MPDKLYVRLAAVTLILSLGLVALGGFVHNTGSSLACPDWPLCFGQVFPKMEGSVAIEHSHRLLATIVGLLTIGLVLSSRRIAHPALRTPLRKGSALALGLVIFQGLLGGATVLLGISPLMSTAHLATSQVFLALLLYLWMSAAGALPEPRHEGRSARTAVVIATILVFFQMLLGASVRHGSAGSVCGLGWDSVLLCREAGFDTGSVAWPSILPARFHMLHRYLGAAVGLVVWIQAYRFPRVRGLLVASGLVALQIFLGVLSLSSYLGEISTTLHLLGASLLWLTLLGTLWKLPKAATHTKPVLVYGGGL